MSNKSITVSGSYNNSHIKCKCEQPSQVTYEELGMLTQQVQSVDDLKNILSALIAKLDLQ